MVKSVVTYSRWEPLPGLPEHPFSDIEVGYSAGTLTVTAHYAIDPPARGLRIVFEGPEAFKVYEEFSDPWMEEISPQPMIVNPKLKTWVWPLQQVAASEWVSRVVTRNGGFMDREWKHFVIVTMDMTLHVMVDHAPKVELLE